MVLWLVSLVLGVVVGLATGGSLARLGSARFRAWPLLIVAVALQAALAALPGWSRGLGAAAACLAVVAWCAANRGQDRRRATAQVVLGLGVALNAIVIALNGGMPVSRAGLRAAGLPATMDIAKDDLFKHVAMTGRTLLAPLGDIFPVRLLHTVVSPGDLLMLAGLGTLAWAVTRSGTSTVRLAKLASRTPSRRTPPGRTPSSRTTPGPISPPSPG